MSIFDKNRDGPMARAGRGFGFRHREKDSPWEIAGYFVAAIAAGLALFWGLDRCSRPVLPDEHDYHVACIERKISDSENPLACQFGGRECFWNVDGGKYGEFNVDVATEGLSKKAFLYDEALKEKLVSNGFDLSNARPFDYAGRDRATDFSSHDIFDSCAVEAAKKFESIK